MRPIQYIQLASSALLITLLASCRTTIPLDLGDNTPRIVINAVATEQQGIDISLSESKPTGVSSSTTNVYYPYYHPDCPYRMTLRVNDQLIPINEVAQYKPQTGDRIAILVEKPGLKAASATTTVPTQPTVGTVEVKTLDKSRRTSWVSNAPNVKLQKGQYLEVQNYELSVPLQGITKDGFYRIIVERHAVMRGEDIQPEEYRWFQEQLQDPSLAKFSSGDLIFESANAYPMNLLARSGSPTGRRYRWTYRHDCPLCGPRHHYICLPERPYGAELRRLDTARASATGASSSASRFATDRSPRCGRLPLTL